MTVVLHSVSTVLIVAERSRMFRFASRQHTVIHEQFVMTIIVIELLILQLIEVGFWGLCLRALGLLTGFSASLQFPGVSHTSLGSDTSSLSRR